MTSERVYTSVSGATSHQKTVCYDAFGQPITMIDKNSSTEGCDLVTFMEYDALDRPTLIFSDWRGNKILERSVIDKNKGTMADTYYVYDALGNMCFVLPPALRGMKVGTNMVWNIHECASLCQYAYFYRYDNRGLLDDGSYSTIDDLTYTYAGNQVVKIDD